MPLDGLAEKAAAWGCDSRSHRQQLCELVFVKRPAVELYDLCTSVPFPRGRGTVMIAKYR